MKKLTKAEIYAKYDILYQDEKILWKGVWIRELLKVGNTKTGRHVYTWSMPAGSDGTCCCDCPGCYAKAGRYNTDTVMDSLKRNQEIVEQDIDFFYRAVSAQLETIGSGEVRIHASGDFMTANHAVYAATWRRIVAENPSFLFWTYTKARQYESLFDGIDNANIVKSIIDGVGYNFGHCDYIINTYKLLKKHGMNVYVCRCGIDKNQHCENCKHCATSDFVLFIEHSTDYRAEQDPLYEELKALIEAQ